MRFPEYLTRPAGNPRHLALSYLGCAALMLVPIAWLLRLQPPGWMQLLVGISLISLAFLAFARSSWPGEPIRWNRWARWGIVAMLIGAAALALP